MQVLSKVAFALALLCIACLAQAGEVILFEHSDFKGRTLTLRGTAPNLDSIDFKDRASSVRVLGGPWEMCTDAEFRGTCRVYRPGEYHSVGPRLNDQFSSARLVGQ